MICEHPSCTGVHSGCRPQSEWCPRLIDSHRTTTREAQSRYRLTAKGMLAKVREGAKQRGNR